MSVSFNISKAFKMVRVLLAFIVLGGGVYIGVNLYQKFLMENKVLRKIVERLEADSRIAEVLVTNVNFDEKSQKTYTTIKFLEYDAFGKPLQPTYYTFSGNIIQFQSLVIRFDDMHIRQADKFRGKSIYLFWKVFMLDGENTQEYTVTEMNEVPRGYKISDQVEPYELRLWRNFWSYILNSGIAKSEGIKNAQIEAPGSFFVPGYLYTIKIEHDGGLRIDVSQLSPILKGEKIL